MRRGRKIGVFATMLAIAGLSVHVAGCNKPERPHPAGPGITAEAKGKKVEEPPKIKATADDSLLTPEQRGIVLADLGGGQKITLGDLEARLAREPLVVRQQFATVAKRKEYLLNWVQFEILADEARKQGMDRDPEVLESLKQQMVRRYLREAVLDTIKAEDITDADIETYYKNNLIMYQRPEQREVRHILLADKAKAEKVLAELRDGSEGSPAKLNAIWKDYVERVSEDKATVAYLGSIGRVSRTVPDHLSDAEKARLGAIPAQVIEAAFVTEPYTLSAVIKSERGCHILMPTSKLPAVNKTLEQVKQTVASRLLKRKRDLKRKELIETLRSRSKIDINTDAVRVLPVPKTGSKIKPDKIGTAKQGGLDVKAVK